MKYFQILALLFSLTSTPFIASKEIKIDHITHVVNNLDQAILEYRSHGFTLKMGRLHSNGLENAFIQFVDGSEIELMSLAGAPKDNVSQNYKYLLEQHGEILTSIALASSDLAIIQDSLSKISIESEIVKSKYWEYLVFLDNPELEHFFIINVYQQPSDSDELFVHSNNAKGIEAVFVENSKEVRKLLVALGGVQCVEPLNIISLSGTDIVLLDESVAGRGKIPGASLIGLDLDNFKEFGVLKKNSVSCKKYITRPSN